MSKVERLTYVWRAGSCLRTFLGVRPAARVASARGRPGSLAGLVRSLPAYGIADVLLVNPIRDGMNRVAHEGPVLSREAGAAELIGASVLFVNPYCADRKNARDPEETRRAFPETRP